MSKIDKVISYPETVNIHSMFVDLVWDFLIEVASFVFTETTSDNHDDFRIFSLSINGPSNDPRYFNI